MTFFQQLLLYACIAFAVFFLMEWALYFLSGAQRHGKRRISRRLGGRIGDQAFDEGVKRLAKVGDSDDFAIDRFFKGMLLNADSSLTLGRLYIVIAAISLCVMVIISMFLPIIPFAVNAVLSVLSGFALPVLILQKQIKSRHDKFAEQFPDAIELIVRSLRVGQPLSVAMKTVGSELPAPLGSEFELVAQEIAYGKDVTDALEGMLQRITLQDLRFFVVAVQIQHESGGNLAEILEGLSKIIRGRFRLMRKVKALTAEGRFSAWFLSLFPVIMLFVMNVVNPGYYHQVADFQYFNHLAVLIVIMLIINVVAMRIITTVKV